MSPTGVVIRSTLGVTSVSPTGAVIRSTLGVTSVSPTGVVIRSTVGVTSVSPTGAVIRSTLGVTSVSPTGDHIKACGSQSGSRKLLQVGTVNSVDSGEILMEGSNCRHEQELNQSENETC